jgi:uncharacterized protein YjbJ (UPF0337 family)
LKQSSAVQASGKRDELTGRDSEEVGPATGIPDPEAKGDIEEFGEKVQKKSGRMVNLLH